MSKEEARDNKPRDNRPVKEIVEKELIRALKANGKLPADYEGNLIK